MTLDLTVACGDYDRTRALRDGTVEPAGIRLHYLTLPPSQTFVRTAAYAEFDASEMSLSAYVAAVSSGDTRFVAIPAFPSRMFRHRDIFVSASSGVRSPGDLAGKRIGLHRYHMTAAIWQRGLLADEYGVRPESIRWVRAGVTEAGAVPRRNVRLPAGLQIEHITERSIDDMLLAGELDAAMLAFAPPSFRRGDNRVQRLFPDPRSAERDYFRRTGIFPIMHVVVLRRSVYERYPWVAQNLLYAFEDSKRLAYQRMESRGASESSLPFFTLDHEETLCEFGADFWPYGVDRNRKPLETVLRYSHEQGLTERLVTVEELFPEPAFEPWNADDVLPGSAGRPGPADPLDE